MMVTTGMSGFSCSTDRAFGRVAVEWPGASEVYDEPSEFARRAIDERVERVLGEPSALDYLGDYVGALPGAIAEVLDESVRPGDEFTAALVDDYQRQLAGLGKREWRKLDADQKSAALAARSTRATTVPRTGLAMDPRTEA